MYYNILDIIQYTVGIEHTNKKEKLFKPISHIPI